ncbi:PAS domain-containing sensor histidine kinase [Magnetospirillum sp. LM-5]|uniref:sensor histidine kinase n=1 Tax=Magnetospirillum sp. LM-5 TaxID=2681466 RepID=UPI0020C4957C|nr:PAS domain-containing sensor histidine kinase [Magnetospirillum sp. LM-5]
MALTALLTTTALPALAQMPAGPAEVPPSLWLDPLAMVLGAAVLASVVVPLFAWQRLRLSRLIQTTAEKEAEAQALLECLASAPDGFYCWMAPPSPLETCSRRLAVLLGLPKGTESDFEDVLAVFAPEDGLALERKVGLLFADGAGFEMELPLPGQNRTVRITGARAADADGERLADLIWAADVSAGAAMVDDLARSLQALASDTTYLKALIDALPMPVWLRDEDLSILAVNRAYAQAVDSASTEAVVHAQIELASDNLVREARALAARARAAGAPRFEQFHLVLAGERRLAQIAEIPVQVGDTLLTAGLIQDETRVEELQSQLDRHVATQGEVLERLATAIAIFTPDTRLAFFNTAFTKLWRLERDWLAGQPTYGIWLDTLRERRLLPETADYRAHKEDELKRFISLIEPIETLMHLPDGRTLRRVVSAHPHGGLIFTFEDVTDSLALERSFNTAMAVQRETLDHLHEGIAVFGGDGRMKLSNPVFAALWGLEPETLQAAPHINEIVERLKSFFDGRPDRASTWLLARERLMSLVNQRAGTTRLERQDGTILACGAVPLPDGACLLTFLDVSDSARVEQALIERNEALAAADTLKSEFIANVSAEVAKPLTTVIGFSEMLAAEYFGKLNKRQSDYIKGVLEAGQTLKGLVADILDLAAIEAGQMTLELDVVDIHPMLASVLGLVKERVREKKLVLDFDCPLDIGWIIADQRRLRQVMFNLIGNAVKFTPSGGSITVSALRDGAELVLTVADTGPGISATDQGRVFDSFTRTAADGAGLGLTLVHRFVDLHGGRVALASAEGQGTIVTVRLPTGAAP